MTVHELNNDSLDLMNIEKKTNDQNEYDSIPLDINDIINICREYNKLGYQLQNQVENILEFGVEDAIKFGNIKKQSLPHIKSFLKAICQNPYFGDATFQACDCINLIEAYEIKNKLNFTSIKN